MSAPMDDGLPPYAGEALRDMLAEHAITLLADWIDAPPVSRCAARRDETGPTPCQHHARRS